MHRTFMSRRDFIKTGAAAAVALYGSAGCLPLASAAQHATPGFGSRAFSTPVPLPGKGMPVINGCRRLEAVAESAPPAHSGCTPYPQAFVFPEAGMAACNPLMLINSGSMLDIHLRNALVEPMRPHWRGLITEWAVQPPQKPLPPGASHRFKAVVRNRSCTMLYHAFTPGMSAAQVQRGLCGLIIVEDSVDAMLAQTYGFKLGQTDFPLLLQDRTLDAYGSTEGVNQESFGSAILVNGVIGGHIHSPAAPIRLRLANGCASRILLVGLDHGGKMLPMRLISSDCDLLHQSREVTDAFLAPGERAEFLVDFSSVLPGTDVYLISRDFESAYSDGKRAIPPEGAAFALLRFSIGNKADSGTGATPPLPHRIGEAPPPERNEDAPFHRIDLNGPEGFISLDGRPWSETGMPFVIGTRGNLHLDLANDATGGPFPLHTPGNCFRIARRTGSPSPVASRATETGSRLPTDLGRKDTTIVWPGETVRIALDFSGYRTPNAIDFTLCCSRLDAFDRGMHRTLTLPPL